MVNPTLLQKAEAKDLRHALDEYPYSGILQALYLKALKNQNNYLFPKQLKRTAIAVPDRKMLYTWAETEMEIPVSENTKPTIEFSTPEVEVVEVKKPQEEPVEDNVHAVVFESGKVSPEIEKKPVVELLKPVASHKENQPVKEDDLDLSNLPASIRETVLRARKVRRQYEGEEAQISAKTEQETASEIKSEPIVEQERTVVSKKPPIKEPVSEVSIETAEEEKEELVVEEMASSTEEIVAPDFELAQDEPIEEAAAPAESLVKSTNEKHSFLDWLASGADHHLDEDDDSDAEVNEQEIQELSFEPELPEGEHVKEEEKASTEKMKELYESFMEKPKIKFKAPSKEPILTAASLSTSGHSDYITETLAQVYVNQKLYNRAINAYEILRLKYPEKSSFFAARISEVKELLNVTDR